MEALFLAIRLAGLAVWGSGRQGPSMSASERSASRRPSLGWRGSRRGATRRKFRSCFVEVIRVLAREPGLAGSVIVVSAVAGATDLFCSLFRLARVGLGGALS